ncbi:MAG: hypothetical protein ACHREM_21835, partial [Polyangiales bacterium]
MRRSLRSSSSASPLAISIAAVVATSTLACGGKMYASTDSTGTGSPGADTGTVSTNDAAITTDSGAPSGRDSGVVTPVDASPVVTDSGTITPVDAVVADSFIADTFVADTTPPPSDSGAPSTTYPAFTIDGPLATSSGGPVLDKATIVTVTWPGDTLITSLEDFGDKIGGTKYWSTTLSEYGIGPAASGAVNHVHMPTAITTFSDSEADALVASSAGNPKTSGWPAPTPETVYILYIPNGVSFLMSQGPGTTPQDACSQGIGGYHTNTQLADGTQVAYAVVPRCNFGSGLTDEQTTTSSASHEIAEAATDPLPQTNPAFNQ